MDIELDGEKHNKNEDDLIKFEGEIFSDNHYDKILKKDNNIDLKNIKYYGGLESFIPLIKIINYIISQSRDNINNIDKNDGNTSNEIINKENDS